MADILVYRKNEGGGGRLPSAYQEVEYIQSSGEYSITNINTGVLWSAVKKIEAKVIQASSGYTIIFEGYRSASSCGVPYISIVNSTTISKGGENISLSSTSYTDGVVTTNVNSTYSYYLSIGQYDNYSILNKYYYVKLYDSNGDLLRNFIPCYRKSDSVAGMYDLVNDVFYTNRGTGSFTVGPDANTTSSSSSGSVTYDIVESATCIIVSE